MYSYINAYSYCVLLLRLEAINASNQGTICSCMIFQPSCFILYFIFPMNLVVFYFSMPFSIMTSPRYYDVTHFLTDLNENCTSHVKLKIRHFVCENFFNFRTTYGKNYNKLWKSHQLSSYPTPPPPPIPFGPSIRVGFVRDTSLTYLRIFFQYLKQKNNSFYLHWWKPGSIPIILPPPCLAPH